MKLIILPGNSKKANEQWENDSVGAFSGASEDVYAQRYSHWDTDEKLINFDAELEKLVEAVKNQKGYVIFGKSAGAMLAIYGVYKGSIKPEKCVFVGLPMQWASEKRFPLEEWLEKFDVPTVIIQQSEDPEASFAEVQAFIAKLKKENIGTVEMEGKDHKYENFPLITEATAGFLSSKEKEGVEGKNEGAGVEFSGEIRRSLK